MQSLGGGKMLETILTWIAAIILAGMLLEVVLCIAIAVVNIVTIVSIAMKIWRREEK